MWKAILIGIIVFWLAIVSISFFTQVRDIFVSHFILSTVMAIALLAILVAVKLFLVKDGSRKKKKRMYYY